MVCDAVADIGSATGDDVQDAIGSPASANRRAKSNPPTMGVFVAGLRTTALPAAIAGATARIERFSGKFHGVDDCDDALWHALNDVFLPINIGGSVLALHPSRKRRSLGRLVGREVQRCLSHLAGTTGFMSEEFNYFLFVLIQHFEHLLDDLLPMS